MKTFRFFFSFTFEIKSILKYFAHFKVMRSIYYSNINRKRAPKPITSKIILHCINDDSLVALVCDKISAVIMIATNSFGFIFYDNLKRRCQTYSKHHILFVHPSFIHFHQITDTIQFISIFCLTLSVRLHYILCFLNVLLVERPLCAQHVSSNPLQILAIFSSFVFSW